MSARMRPSFEALWRALPREAAGARAVVLDAEGVALLSRVGPEALQGALALGLRERLAAFGVSPLPSLRELRLRKAELAPAAGFDVPDAQRLAAWARAFAPAAAPDLGLALRRHEERLQERAWAPAPGLPEALGAVRRAGARVLLVAHTLRAPHELLALASSAGLEGLVDAVHVAPPGAPADAPLRAALEGDGLHPRDVLCIFGSREAAADAAALGARARCVDDPDERKRRVRLRVAYRHAERNPFWRANLVAEVLRAAPGRLEPSADASYRTGRQLAPAMAAFVAHVLERSRELGIERLFFLAREGLTFLRIGACLARTGAFGPPLPMRYLYVSRASTILASMRELSWPELHRFWRQYARQSLSDLLRNLSLPAAEFVPLARACGLAEPQRPILSPESDEAFQRFLASPAVREAFARHRDRAREALRAYLASQGFFGGGRVGLVDVGWKGSMQDNLFRTFEGAQGLPEVHGFYLGYTDSGPLPPGSFKHGFLADTRRQDVEENDLFRNSAILEMATQAHHGSTVGYVPRDGAGGRPVPVLVQHPVERENSERYFRRMQKALFDYAHDYATVRELLPFPAEDLRAGILADLLRYMRYPTREEAAEFLRYSHVESFGVAEVTTFGLALDLRAVLALRHPRRMLGELRRSLERNPWTEGVIRRSGVPLGNFLYDAFRTLDQER